MMSSHCLLEPEPVDRPIGEIVECLRLDLCRTREEFALALGVDVDTVESWEEGDTTPSEEQIRGLLALAAKCGTREHATELLGLY